MNNSKGPLKVALHGMDERSLKMMSMYLQGPCRGAAVVVHSNDAEVDICDADTISGQKSLAERLEKGLLKPVIVLSLNDKKHENTLFVRKPVKTDDMLAALSRARTFSPVIEKKPTNDAMSPVNKGSDHGNINSKRESEVKSSPVVEKPILKKYVISDEQKKTAKHQAAMQLDEKGFGAFVGNVPGIDVNNPAHFAKATYNPKEYFQGYVESAFKVSQAKGQIRQLNSGWNPLIIFPNTDEVWLDVDENQLRAFAGLTIHNTLDTKMSITPMSVDSSSLSRSLERFHSMDAFLWKLACWASKGRYPKSIDINQPVYLKSWPNFTRLLVTPHALRISALLIQSPRTLTNVAQVLNIKPQYVFVFISAACALGLAGQVRREVDMLVQAPEIKPNKNKGLLSRILSTLRGKKA
jgi:hypothetical protein